MTAVDVASRRWFVSYLLTSIVSGARHFDRLLEVAPSGVTLW